MSYARVRLWLGITGVGSLVVICSVALGLGIPASWLSSSSQFSAVDAWQLFALTALYALWLAPIDFMGGHYLPIKYRRSFHSLRFWAVQYVVSAVSHGALFFFFALSILTAGRLLGLPGVILVISGGICLCSIIRRQVMEWCRIQTPYSDRKLVRALMICRTWSVFVPRVIFVRHRDAGFTGGIIGVGKSASIVIPESWLNALSGEELATVIARRATAIHNGSYHLGLLIAFAWNVIGFALCASIPGAGVDSVAALVTSFCAFTLWSFLGLLFLPSVSRNASLQIDQALRDSGAPSSLIWNTAHSLDQMQDVEPDRPTLVETIFHPVPCVSRRHPSVSSSGVGAWNVARTTLFYSWACFGLLCRAVHCNVGRPDLWMMFPVD